jgi:hypothetical protein
MRQSSYGNSQKACYSHVTVIPSFMLADLVPVRAVLGLARHYPALGGKRGSLQGLARHRDPGRRRRIEGGRASKEQAAYGLGPGGGGGGGGVRGGCSPAPSSSHPSHPRLIGTLGSFDEKEDEDVETFFFVFSTPPPPLSRSATAVFCALADPASNEGVGGARHLRRAAEAAHGYDCGLVKQLRGWHRSGRRLFPRLISPPLRYGPRFPRRRSSPSRLAIQLLVPCCSTARR